MFISTSALSTSSIGSTSAQATSESKKVQNQNTIQTQSVDEKALTSLPLFEEGEAEKKLEAALQQVQQNDSKSPVLSLARFGRFYDFADGLYPPKNCGLLNLESKGSSGSSAPGTQLLPWSFSSKRCLGTLMGHFDRVRALAVLPNGFLASGSWDNTVKLWDTFSGHCLSTLTGHAHRVRALAVLPNGSLATGSWDNTIKLWDTSSRNCLSTLKGHSFCVWALTVLPNGSLASGSADNTIKLWDIADGRCLSTLTGHSNWVITLTVLPNGSLASGSADNTIKLWDIADGRCLSTLTGHSNSVDDLAVLPNGSLASGSGDNTIKLWDTSSGHCLSTLTGHSDRVIALAVLPNGSLASGSLDKTIKLWDTSSGHCLFTLTGHSDWINALAMLPNGALASGSMDKTIKLWNPTLNPKVSALSPQHLLPLLQALQTNTSIQTLDLSHNPEINDDIIDLLIDVFIPFKPKSFSLIRSDTTLKTINLCNTSVTPSRVQKFRQAIQSESLSVTVLSDTIEETKLQPQQKANEQTDKEDKERLGREQMAKQETERKLAEEKMQREQQEKIRNEAEEKTQKKNEEKGQQIATEIKAAIASADEQLIKQASESLLATTQSLRPDDLQVLKQIKGKTVELEAVMSRETRNLLAALEQQEVCKDEKLADYYYMFIRYFRGTWIACDTICSGKVSNGEKTSLEYMTGTANFVAGLTNIVIPTPIIDISMLTLTSIVDTGVELYCHRGKKHTVNQIASFFHDSVLANEIIETPARQLTLFQASEIQALTTQNRGVFKRLIQSLKDFKCTLAVDGVDPLIRQKAMRDVDIILKAIVDGFLKPRPTLNEVVLLFRCVAGEQAVYASPILQNLQTQASTQTTSASTSIQVSSYATASSASTASTSVTSSTAMILQTVSMGVTANTSSNIDLKEFREMQERLRQMEERAQKAEERIQQTEAEAKAARDEAQKARKKAEAIQKAMEASGISAGDNSAQLFASASANQNPNRQAEEASQEANNSKRIDRVIGVLSAHGIEVRDSTNEETANTDTRNALFSSTNKKHSPM